MLSALVVFFMIFDGVMKLFKPQAVVSAMAALGYPDDLTTWLGALGLACTFFYAIPRTAIFGAILRPGTSGRNLGEGAHRRNVPPVWRREGGIASGQGLYFRDAPNTRGSLR